MPYDATPTNTTAAVLRRARALIDSPEKWCKGNHAKGANAYCIEGAILMAGRGVIGDGFSDGIEDDAEDAFLAFCRATGLKSPCRWNDAPERTHAEVMAALDRAITLAEAEG